MRPPEDDRGAPRQEDAATSVTTNNDRINRYGRRPLVYAPLKCEHLRRATCWKCVGIRRRAQWELEQVAPVHAGPGQGPWTFGLDERQLRAEARRLHSLGWSVDEITVVLAIAPRAAS